MKKFKTTEIVALIIIGILMLTTIIVGGYFIVNNGNTANKKLESTGIEKIDGTIQTAEEETYHEGEEVTSGDKNDVKDENKTQSDDSNKKESSVNNSNSVNNNETEKKNTSNNIKGDKKNNNKKSDKTETTKKPESNNSGAVQVVTPTTNATHSSKKVLQVNGVNCYVGDTITITMNMKTPEVLMNFQGYTEYDSKYLKFESIKSETNGMFNDHESCIYYNGSDINKGFDFTGNGTMYTATFKVLKEGSTGVVNTIEVLTDKNDKVVNPKDAIITIGVFN